MYSSLISINHVIELRNMANVGKKIKVDLYNIDEDGDLYNGCDEPTGISEKLRDLCGRNGGTDSNDQEKEKKT